MTPFTSVEGLVWALEVLEGRPSDDVVGPLPHLLQTAELLAESHPDDPQLVAAGLVHDIASSLDLGDGDHGALGAELVTPLLGARVGALVVGHVDAKRYLVATDPAYRSILSENSTTTLRARRVGPWTGARCRPSGSGMTGRRWSRCDGRTTQRRCRTQPSGRWPDGARSSGQSTKARIPAGQGLDERPAGHHGPIPG